jgi:hypothetical protein
MVAVVALPAHNRKAQQRLEALDAHAVPYWAGKGYLVPTVLGPRPREGARGGNFLAHRHAFPMT